MKCDELEIFDATSNAERSAGIESRYAYDAEDVDTAIAKLNAEINRKEGVGQRWFAQCMEARSENIKLKRALWLARASEASKEVDYWICQDESSYAIVDFNVRHETIVSYKAPRHRPYKWILIWENVERKCRAKAEEYK